MHIKKTGKAATTLMQLDLQEPMILDSVVYETMKGKSPVRYAAPIRREGNAWWAETKAFNQQLNTEDPTLTLYFHGKPREAVRPPWDGGWIWSKDKQGRPWMSVACQGLGASVWYPCKDHQSDEPDKGASLTMTVPDTLVAVGNGRLVDKRPAGNGLVSYAWNVTNPINNYNIIPYIGKYVTWHEDYAGEKGKLDCDYWVLDYNLDKATAQFKQAPKMLKCFEHWFGPYPFTRTDTSWWSRPTWVWNTRVLWLMVTDFRTVTAGAIFRAAAGAPNGISSWCMKAATNGLPTTSPAMILPICGYTKVLQTTLKPFTLPVSLV